MSDGNILTRAMAASPARSSTLKKTARVRRYRAGKRPLEMNTLKATPAHYIVLHPTKGFRARKRKKGGSLMYPWRPQLGIPRGDRKGFFAHVSNWFRLMTGR